MSETDWIELRPGVPWTTATELNRIARQQGLCLAMAQASVYDEICQVIDLPEEIEQGLVKTYETGQGINTSEQRQRRRVSVTSSEGVYGVLSVTKTQRPTMGNARLAKLNDRVEKTGSGFARAAKTRAVFFPRPLTSTLRSP